MAKHTPSDLYDLFVAPGTTYGEVARMGRAEVQRQITEMRRDEPDNLGLDDKTVAEIVTDYARRQHLGS